MGSSLLVRLVLLPPPPLILKSSSWFNLSTPAIPWQPTNSSHIIFILIFNSMQPSDLDLQSLKTILLTYLIEAQQEQGYMYSHDSWMLPSSRGIKASLTRVLEGLEWRHRKLYGSSRATFTFNTVSSECHQLCFKVPARFKLHSTSCPSNLLHLRSCSPVSWHFIRKRSMWSCVGVFTVEVSGHSLMISLSLSFCFTVSFPQGDRGPVGPTGPVGDKGPTVSTVTQDIQSSASCLRAGNPQSRCICIQKGFPRYQQSYNSLTELGYFVQ